MKIIVVEDNQRIREGLKALIEGTIGFNCVGTFGDCESMFECVDKLMPDLILMDLGLPGMNGVDGIKLLKSRYPHIQTLVLTIHEEEDVVFDAICAGACGYLLKHTSPALLIEAIKEVYNGGSPMSSVIARKVVEFFQKQKQLPSDYNEYNLTTREKEVLKQLVDGLSCKAIATSLFITVEAVRFHFRNIYKKLHVHSQAEVVAKAIKEKLI